ncbi:MAG: hypothetical protein BGN96_13565 [Bacteroidales bacterium 45-6]|nr:MAG: hypothetical protein BGN96_13565 [Bacteroidales bacterium 45-6]
MESECFPPLLSGDGMGSLKLLHDTLNVSFQNSFDYLRRLKRGSLGGGSFCSLSLKADCFGEMFKVMDVITNNEYEDYRF